jgi:hypothetical protein
MWRGLGRAQQQVADQADAQHGAGHQGQHELGLVGAVDELAGPGQRDEPAEDGEGPCRDPDGRLEFAARDRQGRHADAEADHRHECRGQARGAPHRAIDAPGELPATGDQHHEQRERDRQADQMGMAMSDLEDGQQDQGSDGHDPGPMLAARQSMGHQQDHQAEPHGERGCHHGGEREGESRRAVAMEPSRGDPAQDQQQTVAGQAGREPSRCSGGRRRPGPRATVRAGESLGSRE